MDLLTAREAVLTWLIARREGHRLRMEGHPEALLDLGWLGLDWEQSEGLTEDVWERLQKELSVPLRVLDRARPRPHAGVEVVWLPALEGEVPDLESLAKKGIMPEGVLSYLAESAWVGPRGLRHCTRSELLREFDRKDLRSESQKFQPEKLEESHLNFLQELTPAELWERTLAYWPPGDLPDELEEQQVLDLEALALLLGEHCRSLLDFPRLARFYFVAPPAQAHPELRKTLQDANWDELEEVLARLSPQLRQELRTSVLGPELPEEVPDLELYLILGRERALERL